MAHIFAIALNTFRENRRDRVLYVLLGFAVLLVFASIVLGQLTPVEQVKVLSDLGQSAISVIGALIAIFLGVSLVSKEIDRRTVYVIVSKPVRREEFLLGKFAGLSTTLGVSVVAMGTLILVILALRGQPPSIALLQSLVLLYMEMLVITAAALLFSTFTTSTLAAIYTVGVWIVGHVAKDIRFFGSRSGSVAVQTLSRLVYFVIPDLEILNAKARATYGQPLHALDFGLAVAYGLLYTAVLIGAAVVVFSRRDFK